MPRFFYDISTFLQKISTVFAKNSTFNESNNVRAVLEVFEFVQEKRLLLIKIFDFEIMRLEFGFWMTPNWP